MEHLRTAALRHDRRTYPKFPLRILLRQRPNISREIGLRAELGEERRNLRMPATG